MFYCKSSVIVITYRLIESSNFKIPHLKPSLLHGSLPNKGQIMGILFFCF